MALSHPLPSGTPTDGFGPRGYVAGVGDMGFHTGQDWKAPAGTPILAAHTGRIKNKWWDTFKGGGAAGGWMVSIAGDDGLETRYAHLISPSPLSIGQRVIAGTPIGSVGMSGAANGNHLHFEVLQNGVRVNPLPFIGDDDLSAKAEEQIAAIYAGLFGPKNVGAEVLSWESANGPQVAFYGNLEIDIHTQALVSRLLAQVSALTEAVKALSLSGGGDINFAELEKRMSAAVDESLSKLVLRAE